MSLQSKLKRTLENTMQNTNFAVFENNEYSQQNLETNSKFFRNAQSDRVVIFQNPGSSIPEQFLAIIIKMNTLLKEISFSSPIDYIYNPTEYAYNTLYMYINKYCSNTKEVIFMGMNPGPWGMSQTGVPFGEIAITRDWLQITGTVNKPPRELGVRPITGFDCPRTEISGKRFWGLFKELCGTPDNFFRYAFTYNYCPLALMKCDGKNVTPADIRGAASKKLMQICDQAFCEVLSLLKVKIVVGVGRYTEKRAKTVIQEHSMQDIKVLFLPHPSPRVVGSEHWQENAVTHLKDLDLLKMNDKDIEYMQIALSYAKEALNAQEVPVGCIFIYNGEVIASGRNTVNETKNATRHAEFNCIDQVYTYCQTKAVPANDVFKVIDVYVTVEPCIMCAAALFEIGVRSFVYGCKNDRFGGETVVNVSNYLDTGCKIKGGLFAEEAMELLKEFYKGVNPNAPKPNIKGKKGCKRTNLNVE